MTQLLAEYGLLDDEGLTTTTSQVETYVLSVLQSSPFGALLVHELFCLINRKIGFDRTISPPEFVEIIKSMPGCEFVSSDTLVVLKSKFNLEKLNEKLLSYLNSRESCSVNEFAHLVEIPYESESLAYIFLSKIEDDFGSICRDNGGDFEDVVFYKNFYFI